MSFFERLLGGHHRSGGDHHGNGHHQKRTPASYNDPGVSGGIICPNCRTQSSPQARFCQQCGSGLAPPGLQRMRRADGAWIAFLLKLRKVCLELRESR